MLRSTTHTCLLSKKKFAYMSVQQVNEYKTGCMNYECKVAVIRALLITVSDLGHAADVGGEADLGAVGCTERGVVHLVGDDGGTGLHELDCIELPRMGVALSAAMVAVAETPAEPCEPGHLLLMLT